MAGSQNRTVLSGLLVITLLVMLMVFGVAAALNAGCQSLFDANLPIHPDSQITASDFPFLKDKWMELYVPLSATDVRTWYNHTVLVAEANDVKEHTQTAWRGNFDITPAADGTGTRVRLSVSC